MKISKIDLKRNVDRIATNVWKNVSEIFFERLNTNSDAKFEKNENFDEINEIIDWKNEINEINDRIIIDCKNVVKIKI